MSQTQRPFEKGDLVTGFTLYRQHIMLAGEIVGLEHGYPVIHVEDGDNVYIRDFIIKYIRTPRKGGAEARAIVAIVASYYRAKLNKRFRHLLELYANKSIAFAYAKEYAKQSETHDIYEEAKALLK